MLRKLAIFALLSLVLLSGCEDEYQRSMQEAEALAFDAIRQFSIKKNISLNRLTKLQETYYDEDAKVWIISYVVGNPEKDRVSVLVDNFGNVELHTKRGKI